MINRKLENYFIHSYIYVLFYYEITHEQKIETDDQLINVTLIK